MLFFPVWKGAFYAWCAQVPQRARAFHADCASNELKEVEIMTITVSGRKMPVTDALRQYAEEKVGNAIKAVDADTVSTERLIRSATVVDTSLFVFSISTKSPE